MYTRRERLNRLIDAFLENRRESRGSWAKITKEDILDLYEITRALIELKCEQDPDGDYPIDFLFVNRRVEHNPFLHYSIPYTDGDNDMEILMVLNQALGTAQGSLSRHIWEMVYKYTQEKIDKDE